MSQLSNHAQRQTERLALHVGLMSVLIQSSAPLSLVQAQCLSLRQMLTEIIGLADEPGDAVVHVLQLLPEGVAEALAGGTACPDDPSGLFGDDEDGEVR
jgi:hypothetical protein